MDINIIGIIIAGIVGWVYIIRDFRKKTYKKQYYALSDEDMWLIKEEVKGLEGRAFEELCYWLFKNNSRYKNIELTPETHDGGKDLIVTDEKGNKIYVECKRYTDKATVNEEWMIGREILQKLVGAMVIDNIKHGIIATTGNVHKNGWEILRKLDDNKDIKIDLLLYDDIIRMIEEIDSTEVIEVLGLQRAGEESLNV